MFSPCVYGYCDGMFLFFIACTSQADIALMIDKSGSIQRGNFQRVLDFAKQLALQMAQNGDRGKIYNGWTSLVVKSVCSRRDRPILETFTKIVALNDN